MHKQRSLIEKAKSFEKRKKSEPCSDEVVDLALAWVRDEVTASQCALALGHDRK